MGKFLGFYNQKQGADNAITIFHLSQNFAGSGFKTLCIDFDRDAHLTSEFQIKQKGRKSLYELYFANVAATDLVVNVKPRLDIIPAGAELKSVMINRKPSEIFFQALSQKLQTLFDQYDLILFSIPVQPNFLALCSIIAPFQLFLTYQPGIVAFNPLFKLSSLAENLKTNCNIHLTGIVIYNYDPTQKDIDYQVGILDYYFPGKILESHITSRKSFDPLFCKIDPITLMISEFKNLSLEILQLLQVKAPLKQLTQL